MNECSILKLLEECILLEYEVSNSHILHLENAAYRKAAWYLAKDLITNISRQISKGINARATQFSTDEVTNPRYHHEYSDDRQGHTYYLLHFGTFDERSGMLASMVVLISLAVRGAALGVFGPRVHPVMKIGCEETNG